MRGMWSELAHTRSPLYTTHYDRTRSLDWKGEELERLLNRATEWLSSRSPPQREPHPFGGHQDEVEEFVS